MQLAPQTPFISVLPGGHTHDYAELDQDLPTGQITQYPLNKTALTDWQSPHLPLEVIPKPESQTHWPFWKI